MSWRNGSINMACYYNLYIEKIKKQNCSFSCFIQKVDFDRHHSRPLKKQNTVTGKSKECIE